jgi:ABC-type hemin transport system substrate-binding protein
MRVSAITLRRVAAALLAAVALSIAPVANAVTVPLVRVPDRHDGNGIVEKIEMVVNVAGEPVRGQTLAPGRRRSRGARQVAREDREAEDGDVRALVPQRQADGCWAQHRG